MITVNLLVIIIAFFFLLAAMVLLKAFNLPEQFYNRQRERNEIRKQIIKKQIPPDEIQEE